jgi:two-component system response regulator YesN
VTIGSLSSRPPDIALSEIISVARDAELAAGVPHAVVDPRGGVLYPVKLRDYPCWMCHLAAGTIPDRSVIAADHVERGRYAEQHGGHQIFLCASNLMHWVVPVRAGGRLLATIVGGPVRLEGGDTEFEPDVMARLRRHSEVVARAQESGLRQMYRRIPFASAARIEALARQLHRAVVSLTAGDGDVDGVFGAAGTEAGVGGSRIGGGTGGRERLLRESRINEYMQELKRYRRDNELQAGIPTYPLETEQALLDAIAAGEGDRAQGILNELLGHVFFTLGADLERIKVRAREIVVLLSRIVIARGADANRVFGFNYRALDELDGLDDINDVAHWMARIVRGFTGSVLRVPVGAAHTTLLRKVIDYIEETYRGRVSLSAAAQIAGVSSAYLSRVFSAEMGETFSRYVRRMRVQRAQDLLTGTRLPISDIAELAGFADQSHLTAAFRAETGTTPAQFRARG